MASSSEAFCFLGIGFVVALDEIGIDGQGLSGLEYSQDHLLRGRDVETYIQTGNVRVRTSTRSTAKVGAELAEVIGRVLKHRS